MKKQIVVIGLDPFGASVAKSLAEQGHQVLGIDLDEKKLMLLQIKLLKVQSFIT